jgi:hypothetical protein
VLEWCICQTRELLPFQFVYSGERLSKKRSTYKTLAIPPVAMVMQNHVHVKCLIRSFNIKFISKCAGCEVFSSSPCHLGLFRLTIAPCCCRLEGVTDARLAACPDCGTAAPTTAGGWAADDDDVVHAASLIAVQISALGDGGELSGKCYWISLNCGYLGLQCLMYFLRLRGLVEL